MMEKVLYLEGLLEVFDNGASTNRSTYVDQTETSYACDIYLYLKRVFIPPPYTCYRQLNLYKQEIIHFKAFTDLIYSFGEKKSNKEGVF